ncbi:MAG: hypothetical protein ABII02_02135 [Candidatus Magasanikbacteria bacterium]
MTVRNNRFSRKNDEYLYENIDKAKEASLGIYNLFANSKYGNKMSVDISDGFGLLALDNGWLNKRSLVKDTEKRTQHWTNYFNQKSREEGVGWSKYNVYDISPEKIRTFQVHAYDFFNQHVGYVNPGFNTDELQNRVY